MAPVINKDMSIQQVLQMSPEVAKVLSQFNLDCVGCLGVTSETVAQGARAHGIDVDEILAALNAIFET